MLVVVVVVFAAAWYYASAIKDQALVVEREQDRFDLRVLSIEGGRITLEAAAETASNGRWGKSGILGLESADTYNQVGRIVEAGDSSVVRELIALGPLAMLTGCVGVSDVRQTAEFMEHYRAGEFAASSNLLGGPTGLDYQADNLLTSLHVGMALRNELRHDAAREAFDRAEGQLLWKSDGVALGDMLVIPIQARAWGASRPPPASLASRSSPAA